VGVTRIRNAEELQFFRRYIPHAMVQELVSGEEFTCDVLAGLDGRVRCVVPRKRLEIRGGDVSKGLTVKDPAIMAAAQRVVECLPGAMGCITVQCFRQADGLAVALAADVIADNLCAMHCIQVDTVAAILGTHAGVTDDAVTDESDPAGVTSQRCAGEDGLVECFGGEGECLVCGVRLVGEVAAGQTKAFESQLFVGPQEEKKLEEIAPGRLTIYPDPGDGVFTLVLPHGFGGRMEIEVLDLAGRRMQLVRMSGSGGQVIPLDLTRVAAGSYVVVLRNGQRTVSTMLRVMH